MSMKTRFRRRVMLCLALLLSAVWLAGAALPAQAAVPKFNASITSKNVLKLLKAYDSDGYYLVTKGKQEGSDYMNWFFGSTRIVDGLDTAVHEQCHACSFQFRKELIYKGNKKFFTVTYTPVYYSQEMASSVPDRLRTFRFSTYVSQPSSNLSSNVQGAYGLLNEFTAYCWGMNNSMRMFNYYKKAGTTLAVWDTFISNGANGRQAYAEFNYYILHYLYYAKKHHPSVYKGIVNNKSFRQAYKFIEKKSRSNISTYEKDLKALIKLMKKAGHNAYISGDYFWCDGRGTTLWATNYKILTAEVKKSRYQTIYKKLIS